MIGKRGRPSKEELAQRLNVVPGNFGNRAEPPDDLSARQKEIWRETVASEPADYFSTSATRLLLKAYVCHASEVDRLTEIINAFQTQWIKNAEGVKRYSELLKARAKETTALGHVATKLRLTNQSRYTPQAAATANRNTTKGIRPWEE